jgi:hypothetical protein
LLTDVDMIAAVYKIANINSFTGTHTKHKNIHTYIHTYIHAYIQTYIHEHNEKS